MAHPKSDPQQTPKAPPASRAASSRSAALNAAFSSDNILAALQAAQDQLSHKQDPNPWDTSTKSAYYIADSSLAATMTEDPISDGTSSTHPAEKEAHKKAQPTAAKAAAQSKAAAVEHTISDADVAMAAAWEALSAPSADSSSAQTDTSTNSANTNSTSESTSSILSASKASQDSLGNQAGRATNGLPQSDSKTAIKHEAATSATARAAKAAARAAALAEAAAAGSPVVEGMSHAVTAMAAAFGLAEGHISAHSDDNQEAETAFNTEKSLTSADAAMAAAFGLNVEGQFSNQHDIIKEQQEHAAAYEKEKVLTANDAAMAAAFGLNAEGHFSTQDDNTEDTAEHTVLNTENALTSADAAMAAIFGLDTAASSLDLHDASLSLAAAAQAAKDATDVHKDKKKKSKVTAPTLGTDVEHAAEDMAQIGAHISRIMSNNEELDVLDEELMEDELVLTPEITNSGAFASASGDDVEDAEAFAEVDFAATEAAPDKKQSLPEAKTEPESYHKQNLALSAEELENIARYLSAVADAGQNESQSRLQRKIVLRNGKRVPAEIVGTYHYYFEITAPLTEEFIGRDNSDPNSTEVVIQQFNNSSNYHLNNAHEWTILLQSSGSMPVSAELVQVSANSAGTGSAGGVVVRTKEPLEESGLEMAELALLSDNGKHELVTHSDLLNLLAQIAATDASEISDSQAAQAAQNAHPKSQLKQHCPDFTSRLANFVNNKLQQDPIPDATPIPLAARLNRAVKCVTGLRLSEIKGNGASGTNGTGGANGTNSANTSKSANATAAAPVEHKYSPDLNDEQKKAVAMALDYDLSYIITGAQNQDVKVLRELILALMEQRKSILVIDRDPYNLHLIFRATEKALQEQAAHAATYVDKRLVLNDSYQDAADLKKTGIGINYEANTVISDAEAAAAAAAEAEAAAEAAEAEEIEGNAKLKIYSPEYLANVLQRWHNDYPLLRLAANFSAVLPPKAPIESEGLMMPDPNKTQDAEGLDTLAKVSLEAHLQQRLAFLTRVGKEQHAVKEERLENLQRLLTHVQWVQDSQLEKLAHNLKQLSLLKRERAHHQNQLSMMQQNYEQHQERLLHKLTPQIVALRPEDSGENSAELTMDEVMAYSYEPITYAEVEENVKKTWQKIQDDQEFYQEIKDDISKHQSMMRQVMYRPIARRTTTQYTRDNTKLSTVREEYQQLLAQKDELTSAYKNTTADFNRLLLRLRFLKPQHQLHMKFQQLKIDNLQAVSDLSAQINVLHENNVTTFNTERDWCKRCGFDLQSAEFNPQSWKELTTNFLEVKQGIISTQFLMENWRYVADGSLRHLLSATSNNDLSTTSTDDALNEIQKAAALSRAAAAAATATAAAANGELSGDDETDASTFTVSVESISQQCQKEKDELEAIKSQLKLSPGQIEIAANALIEQCPVIGAVPHDAIAHLKHSFNTVIINNAQRLLPIDFWLLTTLARERLIIMGDILQMGAYARLCGSGSDIKQYLYPSIFTLTGIKELLYRYQLGHKNDSILGKTFANKSNGENNENSTNSAGTGSTGNASNANGSHDSDSSGNGIMNSNSKLNRDRNTRRHGAYGHGPHGPLGIQGPALQSLPNNVSLIGTKKDRPQELTTLLNLFYSPFIKLHSEAEQDNEFLSKCENYFSWSQLSPALQEHNVHLIDTSNLYAWMQERVPQDYADLKLASIVRYDGFNVISAAYTVLLAFKLVSSLLICSQDDADAAAATTTKGNSSNSAAATATSAAGAGDAMDDIDALLAANSTAPAPAATTNGGASGANAGSAGDDIDIDALLAANSTAPAAAAAGGTNVGGAGDDLDIDALLAANGAAPAASATAANAGGATADAGATANDESQAFKSYISSKVWRDRINNACASEPRVIIVSLYPQQALLLQLMVHQLYKQLGFTHNVNLVAVSDGATLSNSSAAAVILDLTVDVPYHNGLYFDAPYSDPANSGLGVKREEFFQQHLCSAISAAKYGFFMVGNLTRLISRSLHQNNAVYQLLKTMMVSMKLPLYDARSALSNLLSPVTAKQLQQPRDHDALLDFQEMPADTVQSLLEILQSTMTPAQLEKYNRENRVNANKSEETHNLKDPAFLQKRLLDLVNRSKQSEATGECILDRILRDMEMPKLSPINTIISAERELDAMRNSKISMFGNNEDSHRKILDDILKAQKHVLIMSALLEESRFNSLKPLLQALQDAGRSIIVMTMPLRTYPAELAENGARVLEALKEMKAHVIYTKRCFYQGIMVDDHILWLTSFAPLVQNTTLEHEPELMLRFYGEAATGYAQFLHLPLVVQNLKNLYTCPLCGGDLVFNGQFGQIQCANHPQCGFMLSGLDVLNAQGDLLCPICHGPLHLHIIRRNEGGHGFALRCSKFQPPKIYNLGSSHLLLPSVRKEIASVSNVSFSEIEDNIANKEKLSNERRTRITNELEKAAPSFTNLNAEDPNSIISATLANSANIIGNPNIK